LEKSLTSLGHADTTINNGQRVAGLVRNNVDEKLRLSIELALVCQALKPNFVQCLKSNHHIIQSIKNPLTINP